MMDYERLWAMGDARHEEYRAGHPFPFVIIDDFLPQDALRVACSGFPDNGSQKWKSIHNAHTVNRVVVGSTPAGKDWTPEVEGLFNSLMNAKFLRFMEKLTGIEG